MWTRGELKERGKAALHRNYWIVVLATLVVTALTGGFSNTAGNGSLQDGSNAVAGNGDASATLMQMLFSLFGVTGDVIYKKLIGPVHAGMYASFLLILIMIVISAGLLLVIYLKLADAVSMKKTVNIKQGLHGLLMDFVMGLT